MMQFLSTTRTNCLFWITSLREGEQGVTRRVTEDLEQVYADIGLTLEIFEPKSAQELMQYLDGIAAKARIGLMPLIHFDTHGTEDRGLSIAATGENITWDAIGEKLRTINKIVRNNLCVISNMCFSFQLMSSVDINRPSPFYLLIAPEERVLAGQIEDGTVAFYRELFEGNDILSAHERWFSSGWRIFHSEQFAAIVLSRWIDAASIGRRARNRKEDLITKAVEGGIVRNRQHMRAIRKIAQTQVKPRQEQVNRIVDSFLIGKRPNFDIHTVETFVRGARAVGISSDFSPYDDPRPADATAD